MPRFNCQIGARKTRKKMWRRTRRRRRRPGAHSVGHRKLCRQGWSSSDPPSGARGTWHPPRRRVRPWRLRSSRIREACSCPHCLISSPLPTASRWHLHLLRLPLTGHWCGSVAFLSSWIPRCSMVYWCCYLPDPTTEEELMMRIVLTNSFCFRKIMDTYTSSHIGAT